MVDMDMVDMDIVDGHGGHGIGHNGLKKRSIAMVHYWVRHAKCTWSSFYCHLYLIFWFFAARENNTSGRKVGGRGR